MGLLTFFKKKMPFPVKVIKDRGIMVVNIPDGDCPDVPYLACGMVRGG